MFRSWGNLSPWYSVPRDAFGVHTSPEAPDACTVNGLHFLHRHGARYPTNCAYMRHGAAWRCALSRVYSGICQPGWAGDAATQHDRQMDGQ